MLAAAQNHAQDASDLKAGVALVATGAGGSFAQALTEWASIVVTCGNAIREHALGDPSAEARLQAIENKIVALRGQLQS